MLTNDVVSFEQLGPGVFEPQHDKTNKMMCARRTLRSAWASIRPVFDGCKCHFVGFAMTRLIYCDSSSRERVQVP